MTRPNFAAALPVAAWHPFLPRALQSLAEQNVPLQIALMDASGDPRVADAADVSGLDFAYRRHGPDAGQSAAISEGWRKTEGDIVFWLNADDHLLPGALTLVADTFESDPIADVVYGGAEFIDATGTSTGGHDQVAEISELLLRSNIIAQSSCFARRAAVDAAGGIDAELHFVMDWELWTRLYRNQAVFRMTDHVLSAVFMGEGTKTEKVTLQRLTEVFTLVRRNAGMWAAAKSTGSLAAHTLSGRRT
jgi:GT2 family glycosyltransferase